ncbi:MAG: hypothetical protein ACOCOR_01720, partial [Prevotella sp.]
EQWTENPCVLGSTPRGTTSSNACDNHRGHFFYFPRSQFSIAISQDAFHRQPVTATHPSLLMPSSQ